MNDELQKKLLAYLGSVEKMANDTFIFGKAEIPLYLQELIKWEIAESLMTAVSLFLAAAPCIMCARWGASKVANDKTSYGADPGFYAASGCGVLAAIILTSMSVCNILQASKAYFAPRVLLVEKLSSMVKK